MAIQFIPALRINDDLKTVAAVSAETDSVGIQQGRDYVHLGEDEARRLHAWLGQCLQINGGCSDGN